MTAHDEKNTWFTSELGTTEDSVFVNSDKNNIVRGQGRAPHATVVKGLVSVDLVRGRCWSVKEACMRWCKGMLVTESRIMRPGE